MSEPGEPMALGTSGWHTLQIKEDVLPDGNYADPDGLLAEHRIYANAVNEAVRKYNEAVRKAATERDDAINEAMRTCQAVLKIRADNNYSVKLESESE